MKKHYIHLNQNQKILYNLTLLNQKKNSKINKTNNKSNISYYKYKKLTHLDNKNIHLSLFIPLLRLK